MGYEIKMYVGESFQFGKDNKPHFFDDHAMVDLCKIGHGKLSTLDDSAPQKPLIYIYSSNGNTKIMRDMYDKCLRVFDAQTVLDALKADNEAESYRRYEMAIALLEAAIPRFSDLKVALYGH